MGRRKEQRKAKRTKRDGGLLENPLALVVRQVIPELERTQVGILTEMILMEATQEDVADKLDEFKVADPRDQSCWLFREIKQFLARSRASRLAMSQPENPTTPQTTGEDVDGRNEEEDLLLYLKRKEPKRKHTTKKAPSRKSPRLAEKARPRKFCDAAKDTLGMELSTLHPARLPKPRSKAKTDIDELIWSRAMHDACTDLQEQFQIKNSWERYYEKMCRVGKKLLADKLHITTQKIYDYRASKKQSKDNKNPPPE